MSMPPPVPTPASSPSNPSQQVPNYLAWAIIATVVSFCLCCGIGGIPGIVAIVYAAQVNGKLNQGDFAGAQRASANAKTWCWVATGMAIFGIVLNIVSFMIGGTEQYLQMMQQMQQVQPAR